MANNSGQYREMAYYYDMLMDDIDYDTWIKYITDTKEMLHVKQNDVLEMACGTGNVSVRLAGMGYQVTAFDISQDMLAVASQKAAEYGVDIRFVAQDMLDIKLKDKFGIILCLCDSINYITNKEELKRVFKWVHDHLKDDGVFIFDINSSYKLREIIGENTFTYDNDDIVYIWDNSQCSDNTVEFYLTFFIKQGNLYRRFDEIHIERIYENHEIVELLKAAGFNKINMNDGFTFNGVCDTSERISFVVQKF